MNLAQKTLAIMFLTVVGLMTVLYTTTRVLMLRSFLSLEADDTRAAVERASNALQDDISNLASTTNDYAAWDRTYTFMGERSSDYTRKEFQDDTLQGLSINSVMLVDSSGQIVFFKSYDWLRKQEQAIPIATQMAFASDSWVRKAGRSLIPASGILVLPQGPILISACPILTSRRTGPAHGVLVMTRNLNQARIERLMVVTRSSITITQYSPGLPAAQLPSKLESNHKIIVVQPVSKEMVDGYALLEDVHGQPALLLRLDARRTIFQHGMASLNYFLAAFCLVSLVFGLTTLALLRNAVLNRLARLNAEVSGIADRKDLGERVAVAGRDELTNLGAAINTMLEALQQSDTQFRNVAENIHEVFWIRDAVTDQIVFVSYAYENVWGRTRESIHSIPTSWLEGIHPDDRGIVTEMLAQQNRGKMGSAEYRVVQPDGSIRWVCDRYFPVASQEGKFIQIAGLAEDITEFKKAEAVLLRSQEELENLVRQRTAELATANDALRGEVSERKQAQLALRASEEHFRELFTTIPLPVWLYDELALKFLEVNDAAIEHYGYSLDEFLRLTMKDIEVDGKEWQVAIQQPSSRSVPQHRKHRKKNGSIIDVEIHFQRIHLAGSAAILVAVQDVTERNRMEVELRHGQKMQAVGELAAGIAHEINTPIQFVGDNVRFLHDSFADLLALLDKHEQLRETMAAQDASGLLGEIKAAADKADIHFLRKEIPVALDQTVEGAGRVAKIVQALKKFAHLDQNREMAPADLNEALESTLIVAQSEMKYVADVETAFGSLPQVACYLGDLNQVFLNLLINAAHAIGDVVKQTGKKGKIRIVTGIVDDYVQVSVGDTGKGIPPEIRGRIFEPFFTTKGVGKGTGQGLALAHAIVVERHGGTITFESEVGKGTVFYIRIPLSPFLPQQKVAETTME